MADPAPTLFPYQVDGACFLATRGRALLADEMGLGKTAQAVVACRMLGAVSVAVVCPASVRENWRREFKRFWPDMLSEPMVESYDKVVRGAFGDREFDVLIIDEAHYLKSRKAKRTKAILGPKCDGSDGLIARADHVFLLTGTPTPNNPSEIWPLLRAVAPETIEREPDKPLAYWSFVQRYCKVQETAFGTSIVGGRNLDELRQRIAPFMLRRKKADVLVDLPEIRFDTLPLEGRIDSTPEDEDAMEAVVEALHDGVEGLARIAPHVATLRRLTGLAKAASAAEWVKDWLDAGGRKMVVFAHHTEVLDALSAALPGIARLDGSTTDRQAQVDRFQGDRDCRVFLGQLQAAGTGITLTSASDALFVESSWVPAENEQAAMRIHRIGQRNACLVRFAMLAGSIDERIQKAVMRKTADIVKLFG